jgi:DpnII restriction endonuclease
VTDPVSTTLSAQLGRLRHTLVYAVSASSPDAEFARFVFESVGSPIPFDTPSLLSELEPMRLGRAPALATVGYRLGSRHTPPAMLDAWRQGFQRLAGTNPLPHDRMSFAYRHTEFLGIALGAVALDWDEGLKWLRDVVHKRTEEERTSAWPGLLYLVVAQVLRLPVTPPAVIADADLRLLAFMRWWSARTDTVESSDKARQLDEAFLSRLALAEVGELDVPATAITLQASEAAVRRRVAWFMSSSDIATAGSQGSLGVLLSILRRFHIAVQQLQRRYAERQPFVVNDEYDVQDLLHGVLKLHFDDVRPEEWTPSYGGHSSRVDFLLKRERTIVEAKMTRKGLGQKEVIQQLAIDKEHYRAHPDCETLVCFVYDPGGRCTNPAALESDLARTDDQLRVFVVVAPVGT